MSLNCSTPWQIFLLLVGKDGKTLWKLESELGWDMSQHSTRRRHFMHSPYTDPLFVTVLAVPFAWTSTTTHTNMQHSYRIHILTECTSNWLKYVYLAEPGAACKSHQTFFTSYLGEKSEGVCDRSQLQRAMLGIAAAARSNMGCTCSMGNCILGSCNSWHLWGHAQLLWEQTALQHISKKHRSWQALAFIFVWSEVCWQTNGAAKLIARGLEITSESPKNHYCICEKNNVNHWIFLLSRHVNLGHSNPFTNSQKLNKIHHWMIYVTVVSLARGHSCE